MLLKKESYQIKENIITTRENIRRIFKDFLNGDEIIDIDGIISYCNSKDWVIWSDFWHKVKTDELSLNRNI